MVQADKLRLNIKYLFFPPRFLAFWDANIYKRFLCLFRKNWQWQLISYSTTSIWCIIPLEEVQKSLPSPGFILKIYGKILHKQRQQSGGWTRSNFFHYGVRITAAVMTIDKFLLIKLIKIWNLSSPYEILQWELYNGVGDGGVLLSGFSIL
jgi:hypothetical protein